MITIYDKIELTSILVVFKIHSIKLFWVILQTL